MTNKIKELEGMAMWLRDEVMDEDNWELNAVALGEVICRKLVKCGLLELKDGNYHIPNAFDVTLTERTGKWVKDGCYPYYVCGNCGQMCETQCNGVEVEPLFTKYCPKCGAYMRGVEE